MLLSKIFKTDYYVNNMYFYYVNYCNLAHIILAIFTVTLFNIHVPKICRPKNKFQHIL